MSSQEAVTRGEVGHHLGEAGTAARVVVPAALNQPLEALRALNGAQGSWQVAGPDLGGHHGLGLFFQGQAGGEQLVEKGPERKDVVRFVLALEDGGTARLLRAGAPGQDLGAAEHRVGDPDGIVQQAELDFALQEHIPGGNPPVNYVLGVEIPDGVGQLLGDADGLQPSL